MIVAQSYTLDLIGSVTVFMEFSNSGLVAERSLARADLHNDQFDNASEICHAVTSRWSERVLFSVILSIFRLLAAYLATGPIRQRVVWPGDPIEATSTWLLLGNDG